MGITKDSWHNGTIGVSFRRQERFELRQRPKSTAGRLQLLRLEGPPRIGVQLHAGPIGRGLHSIGKVRPSSDTLSFNSDISIGTLFEPVSVNMVSAQPEPDDDEIELIDTEDN